MAKKKVTEEKRNTRIATLRSVLSRQKNIRVLLSQVVDIDPLSKRVRLADGATFDVLMRVAAHRSHNLTDAIESLPSGLHRPKHKSITSFFSDAA
jgi:NADH dehydrogenase FAD-containing subunit